LECLIDDKESRLLKPNTGGKNSRCAIDLADAAGPRFTKLKSNRRLPISTKLSADMVKPGCTLSITNTVDDNRTMPRIETAEPDHARLCDGRGEST
jgi:hypothetical protein